MNAKKSKSKSVVADEPDWGNPNKSQVRKDTTRAERISGIVWLSIGALFGLFISVLYIGTRITVGDTTYPLPWPIIFAPWFNAVITKTALLWTDNRTIAGIPAIVWVLGYVLVGAWPNLPFGGDTLLPGTLWSMLLMIAGALGAAWPLLMRLPTPETQHKRGGGSAG